MSRRDQSGAEISEAYFIYVIAAAQLYSLVVTGQLGNSKQNSS